MEPSAFKVLNFFKKGQTLPDGTPLKYWNLDIIWSQLKTTADYDNRYPNFNWEYLNFLNFSCQNFKFLKKIFSDKNSGLAKNRQKIFPPDFFFP
jgi:hypothetical protein